MDCFSDHSTASPIRVVNLFSGSKGNCTLVQTPDVTLLVDAGKNTRAIQKSLAQIGLNLQDIDAILVTHEHSDHIASLPLLATKYAIPIHITSLSFAHAKWDLTPEFIQCIVRHSPQYTLSFGNTRVVSFVVSHDSAMSVGYRVSYVGTGKTPFSVGIATDVGCVDHSLKIGLIGCQGVLLESNHDIEMLFGGPYSFSLKERIASDMGHLSNKDASLLACDLADTGLQSIMLVHLSEINNLSDLALQTTKSALQNAGHAEIAVQVAKPNILTSLFEETT